MYVENTHAAINNNVFNSNGHTSDHFYEVKLAKFEVKHEELTILGFFILEYTNLRRLELY